jgi:hypothetical protein
LIERKNRLGLEPELGEREQMDAAFSGEAAA